MIWKLEDIEGKIFKDYAVNLDEEELILLYHYTKRKYSKDRRFRKPKIWHEDVRTVSLIIPIDRVKYVALEEDI